MRSLVHAETINVGQVFRASEQPSPGTYIGFPEFIKVSETNASTRAWNLGGSNQTLNGISLNGRELNGLTLNGVVLNGWELNGLTLNGRTLNGEGSAVQTANSALIYRPAGTQWSDLALDRVQVRLPSQG